MDLGDLISREGVIASLKANSKEQALQELASRASLLTGADAPEIFDTLWLRERLGSTVIGRGIAIPHGTLASLDGIVSLFARLAQPIDFDARDDEPVDLIFLLLAPEHAGADHLRALARISRLLREPSAIEKLRSSADDTSLYAVLTEPLTSHSSLTTL